MTGKPNWTDAPEWAYWLAQNADGEWYWFAYAPVDRSAAWERTAGHMSFASLGPRNPTFYKTLEHRP